jgi:hypothetical protein
VRARPDLVDVTEALMPDLERIGQRLRVIAD